MEMSGKRQAVMAIPARSAGRGLESTGSEVSVRRLQIFWAVAHLGSITKAAKMLGVTQPSLSQQLGAFEAAIGARLFDRRAGGLELTEFGSSILARAEQVLRSMQELEDSLPLAGVLARQTLRIAGAGSVLRTLLPGAIRRLPTHQGRLEFDLYEGAPGEVLDQLYARRAHVGLVAAGSLPEAALGFRQVPVISDPYVLAVPEALNLNDCADLRQLPESQRAILNATAQLVFGTQYARRIQDWYDRVLPDNHILARTRNYETMIEFARAGLGVCIVPALIFAEGGVSRTGLTLFPTGLEPRRIVALFPSQYQTTSAYREVIAALVETAAATVLPQLAPLPPFIAEAMRDRPSAD